MSSEWECRYFSFDSEFGPGQSLVSMRNGSGDEYSITFTGGGAFLRGFAREAPVRPWPRTRPHCGLASSPGCLLSSPLWPTSQPSHWRVSVT
jgi:hypothetical protein